MRHYGSGYNIVVLVDLDAFLERHTVYRKLFKMQNMGARMRCAVTLGPVCPAFSQT